MDTTQEIQDQHRQIDKWREMGRVRVFSVRPDLNSLLDKSLVLYTHHSILDTCLQAQTSAGSTYFFPHYFICSKYKFSSHWGCRARRETAWSSFNILDGKESSLNIKTKAFTALRKKNNKKKNKQWSSYLFCNPWRVSKNQVISVIKETAGMWGQASGVRTFLEGTWD